MATDARTRVKQLELGDIPHMNLFVRKMRHYVSSLTIQFEYYLVGGSKHVLFSIIYGMSSFPLTFIFFRGVGIPPTSYKLLTINSAQKTCTDSACTFSIRPRDNAFSKCSAGSSSHVQVQVTCLRHSWVQWSEREHLEETNGVFYLQIHILPSGYLT